MSPLYYRLYDIVPLKWGVNIVVHGHGMKEFSCVQHLLSGVASISLCVGRDLRKEALIIESGHRVEGEAT